MPPSPWLALPTEMKFAIMDNLAHADVDALSRVDSATYHACIPALFHTVRLRSYDAIRRFLCAVPASYRRHIHHLDLCMLARDDADTCHRDQACAVATLLTCCSRLEKLVLRMAGSMDNAILAAFPRIPHLQDLAISNCLPEEDAPVSERLVVHIAASLPNLHTLTLDRISRSTLHSPDIAYAYPPIPRVVNDNDVPPHPLLGAQLNLPSLLLLPALKNLSIRDTHLGDPQWEDTARRIACRLVHLDLGGSYHESDDRNAAALQRVLKAAAPPTLAHLSLSTPLPPSSPPTRLSSPAFSFSSPPPSPSSSGGPGSFPFPPSPTPIPPLAHLQTLRMSPYFPIDALADTLAHFEGAPVHTLTVACFDMDAADACLALEDFMSVRVCRGVGFYDGLRRVDVVVVMRRDALWKKEKREEVVGGAVRRLVGYCRDLGVRAVVRRRVEEEGLEEEWDLDLDGEECCW